MPLAHCSIGTSTDRINLLDESGIHVGDWVPVAGDIDIVSSSSPLADYSRLRYYREVTTAEAIDFTVKKQSQDEIIVAIQNLRRMCRAAMDYWVENWNDSPVYMAVQASCETNRRYAIVHTAKIPEDNNPFGQPFLKQGSGPVMIQQLLVERGPWLDTAPGVATCIEACAPENYYCWPSYLEFTDGDDDNVDCGNNVALSDLPSPDGITVEAWIRPTGWGQSNQGCIVSKINNTLTVGWRFYLDSSRGLCGYINFGTQDAWSASGTDEFSIDGEWHHVAMTFHPTSLNHNGYIRLWIDGDEVSSYQTYQQGQGAYSTDAALNLNIGNHDTLNGDYDGDIGWVRLSDAPIYQAAFTAPARCEIPTIQFYTVAAWIIEGTGATAFNLADPGAWGDGAITGADWACDCDLSFGRMCGDLDPCWPAYLHFDGVLGLVNAGDYAAIQDLPDDTKDMIAEAWVKADGWGANNAGHIISKENHPTYTTGWNFVIVSGTGLYGYVNGAGGAAFHGYAGSGTDEFSPDGQWHHVVMAVDSGVGNVADIYLAVDGVWVTSYSTRQQKTGAYGSDVGDNLIIGNRGDGTYAWDGDIAWVRLSDTLRYTPGVNFTPPVRCTIPDVDANTAALWIYEGAGSQTWNLAVGEPANIYAALWECDCELDVDQSTSCIVQPYVANYLKTSGLTHVYFTDASGPDWSTNLMYANPPYLLLPPVPAAADAVYFGVDSTLVDSGPFCNLVFDIGTAQSGISGIWEWWDSTAGAWVTLTVQDNTDADGLMTGAAFDTTGIKSVHWSQDLVSVGVWMPGNLQTVSGDATAPPVNAYWIRWRVTSVATPTPPWQQNRAIYTISWPYVQIEEDDVPGDIAAALAAELFNESDHDGGIYDPILATNRLVAGLRSTSRGEDFVAFLNAADEQNPPFITCTVNPSPAGAGSVTFNSALTSPTGRYVQYVNLNAADMVCYWSIDADYSNQFFGVYRAFVRARISGGSPEDAYFALGVSYNIVAPGNPNTEYRFNQYSENPFLVDIGRIAIPPSTDIINTTENASVTIALFAASNTGGAINLDVIDVMLMPVDEWAGEFIGLPGDVDYISGNRSMAYSDWGGGGRYLFVDSITYPKTDLRAVSKIRSTGNFVTLVKTIANRPAALNENNTQRLWFLAERFTSATGDHAANIEISHSVQVYAQAHYLSMRGNR